MHIYSATPLSAKQMSKISDGVNSFFEGRVPSSEIEKIQKSADILVHVEGLSLKSRLAVHQSFSTKIVDYLKNARAVFVVGPSDAASVDYFCATTVRLSLPIKMTLRISSENIPTLREI